MYVRRRHPTTARMAAGSSRVLIGVLTPCLFLLAAGCGEINTIDTGTAPSSSTSNSTSSGGGGITVNGGSPGVGTTMSVAAEPPTNVTYLLHNATDTTTFTTPCEIPMGTASPNNDIQCILEGMELDLFYWGAKLQFNVPPAMCSYVIYSPYFYETDTAGQGPIALEWYIDKTGVAGDDTTGSGTVNEPGVFASQTPGGLATLVGTSAVCTYDHSGNYTGAPNCCTGDVVETIHTWDSTTSAYNTTTSTVNWGGSFANCLAGPAMDTQPKDTEGIPKETIADTSTLGIAGTYSIEAPINKNLLSDAYVANYFTGAVAPAPMVQPYYDLECLDGSGTILARIRTMIRKWNTADQFALLGAGNPNVGGDESAPFGFNPNDNFFAWYDFVNLTGNASYPTFPYPGPNN